ncbi:MAG: hypothetical protein AAF478_12720 [Pseudomonadota bacterium]
MFKFVFIGVWVVIVFSASIFVASGKHTEFLGGGGDGEKGQVPVETMKMLPMSVALIREGTVKGYLVVEPAFTYILENKKSKIPIDLYFQDALVNYLFNNEEIDVERLEKFDLIAFRERIKVGLNAELEGASIDEVLIQRIDYLSVQEVRDNKLRSGYN